MDIVSSKRRSRLEKSASDDKFLIHFHNSAADSVGVPLNSYSRYASRHEATVQCSIHMDERTVEQKLKGIFFSVQQIPDHE